MMSKRPELLLVVGLLLVLLHPATAGDDNSTPKGDTGESPAGTKPSNDSLPADTSQCKTPPAGAKGKAFPKLDDKFISRVECHFLDKKTCVEIEEYYDGENNRGSVIMMKGGIKSTYIYDFTNRESYTILNGECTTKSLVGSSEGFSIFRFGNKSTGHIASINDILYFGTKYDTTFVDSAKTVRSMPVDHWQSCIQLDAYQTEFKLDWYWTQANYSTALGQRQIPVRATMIGNGNGKDLEGNPRVFNHTYDFTWYRPGDLIDDHMKAAFEIPRGVFCQRSDKGASWPGLSNQFFASIELNHADMKSIATIKRYYDFTNKLSRKDLIPDTESYYNKFGKQPLSVIRDYSLDMEFVINKQTGKCTMDIIQPWADDAKVDVSEPDHVHMMAGDDIMGLGALNFTFQGQKEVRGIPCDVWTAAAEDWPKEGSKSTVEMYYMSPKWTSEAGKAKTKGRTLIGMWINTHNKTGSDVEPHNHAALMQVYDFTTGPEMFGVFDVTSCFNTATQMKHLVFRLDVTYREVSTHLHFYEPAIKDSLARAANVSAIRLGNFYFHSTVPSYTDVWVFLTDIPKPKEGHKGIEVPQASLDEAYKKLKKLLANNDLKPEETLVVAVNHSTSDGHPYVKTVYAVSGSLATDKEVFDPRKEPPPCIARYGYSSGSMAGLAFAMLFFGLIGGVAVGWYLWRRKRGIPYSVHR